MMTKAIGKMLLGALAGAVFGYLVMYFTLNSGLDSTISWGAVNLAFELMIVLMVISVALIIFNALTCVNIVKKSKRQVSGDEEDELEELQNKRYGDGMLAANIAMYTSTGMLALVGITAQPIAFIFISLGLLLLSLSLMFITAELAKVVDPNREYPSVNDKQYAKKLMEMSDDGERHIMLHGLYRAFTSINILLFFAVLALIAYSVLSGISQLAGILIILFILIFTNAQYMLSIRKK